MANLHAKFHVPYFSVSLVTVIKLIDINFMQPPCSFIFYRRIALSKLYIIQRSVTFQDHVLNGISVTPTSQFCASAMLPLCITGNTHTRFH